MFKNSIFSDFFEFFKQDSLLPSIVRIFVLLCGVLLLIFGAGAIYRAFTVGATEKRTIEAERKAEISGIEADKAWEDYKEAKDITDRLKQLDDKKPMSADEQREAQKLIVRLNYLYYKYRAKK